MNTKDEAMTSDPRPGVPPPNGCGCCECRGVMCFMDHPGHSHHARTEALPPVAPSEAPSAAPSRCWSCGYGMGGVHDFLCRRHIDNNPATGKPDPYPAPAPPVAHASAEVIRSAKAIDADAALWLVGNGDINAAAELVSNMRHVIGKLLACLTAPVGQLNKEASRAEPSLLCEDCKGRGCHDDEPDTLPTRCRLCNGTGYSRGVIANVLFQFGKAEGPRETDGRELHNGQQEPPYASPKETVTMRLADIDADGMVCHLPHAECAIQPPHRMSECGRFAPAPSDLIERLEKALKHLVLDSRVAERCIEDALAHLRATAGREKP